MEKMGHRNLLLISNSTLYGRAYLDHAENAIRSLLGSGKQVIFVPHALFDRSAYTSKVKARFSAMGLTLSSVHDVSNMARAVRQADAIFVGGGNTFRLVKALHEFNLISPIRDRVEAGIPYIGSSAGAIVAGPSLRTTKDMPVVQPPSFDALGLVHFQISPHYLDPDPSSTHMGETQEERINQFLEENETPVVGLREGSMLKVENETISLLGTNTVRIFRRGFEPLEANGDLSELLAPSPKGEYVA
jgi:dipeptidase E